MSVTTRHNPGCGTSRGASTAAGLTACEGMRVRGDEAPIETLGLTHPDPERDAARAWDAMTAHPILIGRPLVAGPRGTVLARPSERALEALADPDLGPFAEEDGEAMRAPGPAADNAS